MSRVNLDEAETAVDDDDIAWGDEGEPDEDEPQSGAILSINGKVMGNLDDLVKQPTEEFKDAMREIVERAMPPAQVGEASGELANEECADFARYENVIARGLTSFIEVGNALIAIREKRLYRAIYGTFEQYCRDRWRIESRRAYQLMDAAGVVSNIADDVKNFSYRESHVAPFAKLPKAQQREAFEEGIKSAPNGKVTATHMQKAAVNFAKPKPVQLPEEAKTLQEPVVKPARVVYLNEPVAKGEEVAIGLETEVIINVAFRAQLLDKLLRCVRRSSLLFLTSSEHKELAELLEMAMSTSELDIADKVTT